MDQTAKILTRGVEQIIDEPTLRKKLESKGALTVKLGIDPTTPHLHLGHSVVLLKLRQFQDAGHLAVLVIGDFTALVGDPSGRDTQRPVLTPKEIEENWKDYQKQASKILDMDKVKVVHNSDWFGKIGTKELFELMSKATINQLLERKDFKDRLSQDNSLTFLEMLYPLLQGYDSVELKAAVELGGTDQLFNLLMGRQMQKRFGQKEQDILMTPLLIGLDGKDKMSKTSGNFIGLTESPENMFGKVMKIPDELIKDYFLLCTQLPLEEIEKHRAKGPYEAKKELAKEIVSLYHSTDQAQAALDYFNKVYVQKKPENTINSVKFSINKISGGTVSAAAAEIFGTSNAVARRMAEGKGLKINGEVVSNPNQEYKPKVGDQIIFGRHRAADLEE